MLELQVMNSQFEVKKTEKTELDLSKDSINEAVVHRVVRSALASRRQGNASTKNKALVSGGGKKPFKQKGTGRARQGSSRSPLMPGGGTVFGPQPRLYEKKVNKKEMLVAVKSVIADKYQAGKLLIVDSLPSDGKTSQLYKNLKNKNLLKSLIIVSSPENLILRAARNIKSVAAYPVAGFSVYEAVKFENLIIEKEAFASLEKRLEAIC